MLSKSSPIVPSSEKDKVSISKMWKSFAGPDDFGDTQPVDTQAFVADSDITTSRVGQGANGHETIRMASDKREGRNGTAIINLMGNVEEQEPEVDYDDVSDVSSEADELAAVFKVPKTPATNGRKRNARGEVISSEARTSATRTPGSALAMAAMFGNGGVQNMSLSQLFKATQAASSPLPNAPKSDPIFERPSPNINFRNSSPVPMQFSSPTRPSTADGLLSGRIPTDPLDTYVPMNESQEERQRRLCKEQQITESLEDDEFEESMSGALWRQQQRNIHQNALTRAAELTAPDRVRTSGPGGLRITARSKSVTDIATPARPPSSGRRNENVAMHSDVTDVFSDVQQAPLPQESSVEEIDVDEIAIVGEAQRNSQERTDGARVPETSPHAQSQLQRNSCRTRSPSSRSPSPTKSPKRTREAPDALTTTQKTVVVVDSQAERIDLVEEQNNLARPLIEVASPAVSSQVRITQTQSQYSSLKPENRALLSQRILGATDTFSLPQPPPLSPRLQAEERMPSSPPLLPMDVSEDDDESLDELDDEEVDLIGAEAGIVQFASIGQLPQIIAETALDEHEDGADQLHSSRPPNRDSQTANTTGMADAVVDEESAPFATANSHLSPSTTNRARDTDSNADSDRLQVGEIRKFADLVVEGAPQNSIESVDINFNILTQCDEQFHNVMSGSSPVRPKKRTKVYGRSALREPAKKANIPNSDVSQDTVETRMQPSPRKRENVYDAPESTPVRERVPTPTPQSTRKREQKGANAASHARQAILVTKNVPSPKSKSISRANTISKESHVPRPSPSSSGRPRPRSLKILEVAETPSLGSSASNRTKGNQPASSHIRQQASKSKKGPSEISPQQDRTAITANVAAEEELFPNRVLAMFRANMSSYTATVLGVVRGDGIRFKVRYDDGNEDILDSAQIRKLDLRVGDRVKVEMPKMKTNTYVVVGFSNKITLGTKTGLNGLPPLSDIYGHLNVRLRVKGRESLPTPEATSAEVFDIPVAYIYLPRTMMSNFADRKYLESSILFDRLATPSNIPSAPSTPSSRSRRQPGATTSLPSVIPTITELGLFANMAFAVTFSDSHDKEKEATLNLIQSHGARIIEIGFDQLFDLDPSGAPTPRKSSPRKSNQAISAKSEFLNLTQEARNLGFTALIADRYCRRAKYMQALALSIPCLHYRWVTDSIAASTVLPFHKYLLPAGESAFLSGAVRSRALVPYDPCSENASLKNILSRRDLLLGGKSVLVVKGKGRAEEKRKVYLFLTYALGAAEVGRVKDLAEAKTELEARYWDWVYVDGEAEEAKKVLFGKDNGKKRKRESAIVSASVAGKVVKVVGDEFVIQSLILGGLMED
jgi:hypothetical protein